MTSDYKIIFARSNSLFLNDHERCRYYVLRDARKRCVAPTIMSRMRNPGCTLPGYFQELISLPITGLHPERINCRGLNVVRDAGIDFFSRPSIGSTTRQCLLSLLR